MWIEERNGKYKYIERYEDPFTGEQRKVSVTYTSNSRQAQKQAQLELQQIISERLAKQNDAGFFVVGEEYIKDHSRYLKATTIQSLHASFKTLQKLFPKHSTFNGLKIAHVQRAFNEFYDTHSYNHTKMIVGLFKRIYRYALRMEYIDNISIIEKIEIKRKPKTASDIQKEQSKFLDRDELKSVLAQLKDIDYNVALVCEFQALTGLRFGELVALRTEDYNRQEGYIDVNGTIQRVDGAKGEIHRSTPKNAYSVRTVTLDARAKAIIEHFITASQAKQLWNPKIRKNSYIFTSSNGWPIDSSYVNKKLKFVALNKKITTHTFRHTHISMLAEQNVPIKAIMQRVGHNEPRTTMAIYTHVTSKMDDKVKDAITDIGNELQA